MAISKDKKVEIYSRLKKSISKAKSVVFVNFHGLGVIDTTDLRKKLKREGIEYFVAKKTLTKRALDEISIEGEMPVLEGELALACLSRQMGEAKAGGEDLIAPAREIYEFQKGHKESIKIVGGIFEGRYMNMEEMMSIATIPPISVLYGQFVNLINSPIQSFVMTLSQIAEQKTK